MLFCFLRLADVIAALVVIRILLQYLVQAVGVIVLRIRRPDMPRPFRMWLYPVPALRGGGDSSSFCFAQEFFAGDSICGGDSGGGIVVYCVRAWRRREWPFGSSPLVVGG